VRDELIISLPNQNSNIYILNAQGDLVKEFNSTSNKQCMNVSWLPDGLFIFFVNGGWMTKTEKVVINK